MINLFQAQKLSLKKIGFSKGKSLFVIVPISLMFGIIVLAASEASNLIQVAHDSIFSPIQSQNEIIELNKSSSNNFRNLLDSSSSSGYTTTDNTLISNINNVEQVSLISALPISLIKTTGLTTDNSVINISSLAGLDAKYASLYTTADFSYQAGQPIPIILNANDFTSVYEDWQGKTEIDVDYTQLAAPPSATTTTTTGATDNIQSPIKTKAIAYDRNNIIGKTITINFGGLDTISDISQQSTATGYKYVIKTQDAIDAEVAARKTAISLYWDYDKISAPLSYTFVVAGISAGNDKTMAYVPTTFAQKLMQDYTSNELAARNSTAMPTADQNATYTGLVYDGVSVQTDTTSSIFAGIRNQVNNQITSQINTVNGQIDSQNQAVANANSQNAQIFNRIRRSIDSANSGSAGGGTGGTPGADRPRFRIDIPSSFKSVNTTISKLSSDSIKVSYAGQGTSYSIPGLVFNKDRTTGDVSGEYTGFTADTTIPLPSTTILIKIKDIASRAQVVTDLNAKGFSYQDYSQYQQYDKLESYLTLILNVSSIIFMAVTALFILINMAKFVSEGRKEIGIFRAIGATKGDIRLIFILQSLSYIVLSLVLGAVVGVLAVLGLSQVMVGQAQSFINQAVGSSVVLNANITQANFIGFDYRMILLYAGGLLLVTLLVSLIPSGQAARVSPVEAIRNS